MWTRGYLVVSVLVWLGYGLYCFFAPATVEQAAGLVIGSSVARTEVRAMYGGLQIAIGVMALAALLRPALVRPTLLCLAFLVTGLAVTRALGAVMDGSFGQYTTGAIFFEVMVAGGALALLRSAPAPETPPATPGPDNSGIDPTDDVLECETYNAC